MFRSILRIALLVAAVPVAAAQDSASRQAPTISLTLPSDIPSETVQINYFMIGPFGGYGDFVRTEKGRTTYDVVASVDGKAAANVKVIAYLPGCEIATLEIPMQGTTLSRPLSCKLLSRILLRGQISPISIIQDYPPAEVEVDYLAMWDHQFFGIVDGPVISLHVATVVPDEKGQFEVAVPDFSKQTNLGEGEFQFILRQTTTGNIIAFLRPTSEDRDDVGLKVRPSYPQVTQFLANRH
jgi:hypothetical protein